MGAEAAADRTLPAGLRAILQDPGARVHYVGVAGSGVSALAQYRVQGGGAASGSDRAFDGGSAEEVRRTLEGRGVSLHLQDGSGVRGAALVVASRAVEPEVPDLAAARELGIPVVSRADMLAHETEERPSLAVAGTSGKSTTAAMAFQALRGCGLDPGLLAGGCLRTLQAEGWLGNAWRGRGPLVVEADESDGSLVGLQPLAGVILNLHRDHKEPREVLELFAAFKARCREGVVLGEDPGLAPLRREALVSGFGDDAGVRGLRLRARPDGSVFEVDGVPVLVPVPGAHNAANALAALAAVRLLGADLLCAAPALARFGGLRRRFEVLGRRGGVEVVDDFAHNPDKLAATLEVAHQRAGRVLALFQPHGFAPLAFYREQLVETLVQALRAGDRFWLAPVYYAGGTAQPTVSSADVAAELAARGAPAEALEDAASWPELVAREARPGDVVLVMGARDPGLPGLARRALAALPAGG